VSIDEELIRITHAALDECTEAQRAAYRLVHGINEDGEPTASMPMREAARTLNVDPANMLHGLRAAEAIVLARCCRHMRDRIAADEEPSIVEAVGTMTGVPEDVRVGYSYSRHDYTERTINLGAGSEAAIRAGKGRSDASAHRGITWTDVHQRYADGGRHA
jgi:hypothetical protein